jgi:hypothetical protein
MQERLAARGRKMVTIIDPHIKRDSGYFLHSTATDKGYYIKNRHGSDFDGWCWPGSSSYLDFTRCACACVLSFRVECPRGTGCTIELSLKWRYSSWLAPPSPFMLSGADGTVS